MSGSLGYIEQLVRYIRRNLAKGYTVESLKWALESQGYSRSEIAKAIKIANEQMAKEAPKLKEKPIIKVEREPLYEEDIKEKIAEEKGKISFLKRLKEMFS